MAKRSTVSSKLEYVVYVNLIGDSAGYGVKFPTLKEAIGRAEGLYKAMHTDRLFLGVYIRPIVRKSLHSPVWRKSVPDFSARLYAAYPLARKHRLCRTQ